MDFNKCGLKKKNLHYAKRTIQIRTKMDLPTVLGHTVGLK